MGINFKQKMLSLEKIKQTIETIALFLVES
jgi:hypothetical protein